MVRQFLAVLKIVTLMTGELGSPCASGSPGIRELKKMFTDARMALRYISKIIQPCTDCAKNMPLIWVTTIIQFHGLIYWQDFMYHSIAL